MKTIAIHIGLLFFVVFTPQSECGLLSFKMFLKKFLTSIEEKLRNKFSHHFQPNHDHSYQKEHNQGVFSHHFKAPNLSSNLPGHISPSYIAIRFQEYENEQPTFLSTTQQKQVNKDNYGHRVFPKIQFEQNNSNVLTTSPKQQPGQTITKDQSVFHKQQLNQTNTKEVGLINGNQHYVNQFNIQVPEQMQEFTRSVQVSNHRSQVPVHISQQLKQQNKFNGHKSQEFKQEHDVSHHNVHESKHKDNLNYDKLQITKHQHNLEQHTNPAIEHQDILSHHKMQESEQQNDFDQHNNQLEFKHNLLNKPKNQGTKQQNNIKQHIQVSNFHIQKAHSNNHLFMTSHHQLQPNQANKQIIYTHTTDQQLKLNESPNKINKEHHLNMDNDVAVSKQSYKPFARLNIHDSKQEIKVKHSVKNTENKHNAHHHYTGRVENMKFLVPTVADTQGSKIVGYNRKFFNSHQNPVIFSQLKGVSKFLFASDTTTDTNNNDFKKYDSTSSQLPVSKYHKPRKFEPEIPSNNFWSGVQHSAFIKSNVHLANIKNSKIVENENKKIKSISINSDIKNVPNFGILSKEIRKNMESKTKNNDKIIEKDNKSSNDLKSNFKSNYGHSKEDDQKNLKQNIVENISINGKTSDVLQDELLFTYTNYKTTDDDTEGSGYNY